jgi:NAD(P)-dependent dehydrogenase (short-subunit alcohol dehydrogenase family)
MAKEIVMKPVLLITGASRGIGAATARLAAARGFDVAINYKSDEKAAGEVIAAVQAQGAAGLAVQGDMGVEADVEGVFAAVDAKLGPLTHLVYNCGITGRGSRLEDADSAMMRQVMEVNVLGALWSMQRAIARMSKKRGKSGGAVVLISSMAATLGGPNEYVWYAASKGAVESLTVGLSRELALDGIRVNAVSPGMIATEIHASGGMPDRVGRLSPMLPMARPGQPEEVAEGILFLLSDAASYITGTVLRVSGGR